MQERVQKILSAAGLMSRRAAEEKIRSGGVTINGMVCELGAKADLERDRIEVDGKLLKRAEKKIYILLHKPAGYVTTLQDEKGRKNVTDLVKEVNTRIYPVGRLDMFSEGLLLMTNDGEFANRIMHPSHGLTKTYETTVCGTGIPHAVQVIQAIRELEGQPVRPAKVKLISHQGNNAVLHISITDGRNRQVRRLCELAGLRVDRLIRIREGSLELGTLPVGCWRHLTEQEINELMNQ